MEHEELTISLLSDPSISVSFQYVPEEISDSRKAKYATIEIPGRSNPHFHYVGGSDNLSLNLKYQVLDAENKYALVTNVARLKAFAHGSDVVLTFGDMYDDGKIWKFDSVATKYKDFATDEGYVACTATVALSFSLNREASFIPEEEMWLDL